MTKFHIGKKHFQSLLLTFLASVLLIVIGCVFFIYYKINFFCSDSIKLLGITNLVCGIFLMTSTIIRHFNTVLEVIVNDDFISINKAGFSNVALKSKTVYISDIISATKTENNIFAIASTTITLTTKTGDLMIKNMEKSDELVNLLNEKINNR